MSDDEHDGRAAAIAQPAPRRHTRLLLVAGLFAGVAAAAAGISVLFRPDPPAVTATGSGRTAPAFEVTDIRDEERTIALADFRGRPVVLNFWASWCGPCRKEMPAFQDVYRRTGDNVTFLGMNHQDSRDDALDLLAETGVRYPSGYDPQGEVAQAYKLFGMPTTVFISGDGRILATRTGEITEEDLESALAELFDVSAEP